MIDEAGDDLPKQIEAIYLRAFSRRPRASEIAEGRQAIDGFRKGWPARLAEENTDAPRGAAANWLALSNYCHTLLNSAEFSFID